MKNLLLAGTAAVILSGPAFAADLPARMPVKAPLAAPAPFSWSGCYLGAHAGAGWARTDFSDTFGGFIALNPGDSIRVNGNAGFVGGGQVGCDYQFASNWVIGIAGDFSWANIEGEADDPFFAGKFPGPLTLQSRTDFLASATGRVGYSWDHYLLYAKGGAAWSHDKYEVGNFLFCGASQPGCHADADETRFGWIAGGGFEWAFAPNWSAFVEYDHYGFGTKDVTLTVAASGGTRLVGVRQDIDLVKVGLNYRFGNLLRW